MGFFHVCWVTNDGVYCHGGNASGQLGDNTTVAKSSPTKIAFNFQFSKIAAGLNTTYAIGALDGKIYSWGLNSTFGELCSWTNPTSARLVPLAAHGVLLNGTSATMIAAGVQFVVAVDALNLVWTCGRNDVGQLSMGDNNT
ncbi:hypothetical protein RXP78_29855, partial [Pseudomonas aeruginosa]|nr:hypothetical protein [Pseudomonas aeruginosa]